MVASSFSLAAWVSFSPRVFCRAWRSPAVFAASSSYLAFWLVSSALAASTAMTASCKSCRASSRCAVRPFSFCRACPAGPEPASEWKNRTRLLSSSTAATASGSQRDSIKVGLGAAAGGGVQAGARPASSSVRGEGSGRPTCDPSGAGPSDEAIEVPVCSSGVRSGSWSNDGTGGTSASPIALRAPQRRSRPSRPAVALLS